jgi:hypothetical protein
MSDKAKKIIDLLSNKDRQVNMKVNSNLWDMFSELAAKENKSNTAKVEELIICHLEEKGII